MIDASIPLQVKQFQPPDQLGTLAKVLQLQGANQGVRLADLQYQELQRKIAEDDATKVAYAAYTRDPTSVSLAELASKNPKLVQDILKQQRETLKDNAQIEKDRAEAALKTLEVTTKKVEQGANILSGAKDQATYELALAAMKERFGDAAVAQFPAKFDAAWVAQKTREGLQLKDRLTQEFNDRKFAWEQEAKKVDQGIAQQNATSSRISAGAAATSASAAVANARTAAGRLDLERQKINAPEGVPIELTRKDNGDKVLVFRTGNGQLVDANTRQPINYEVSPKAENITPEGASKVALMKQARQDIDEAKGILFNDKGELRRMTAAAMSASGPFGIGAGGVGEEARKAYSRVYNAVAAKLRMETGAAAPSSEVADIARRFMPSAVMDTSVSAKDKLERLQEFMDMGLQELERGGYVRPGSAGSTRATAPTAAQIEAELKRRSAPK